MILKCPNECGHVYDTEGYPVPKSVSHPCPKAKSARERQVELVAS